jgi:uncharacterized membrane protein
MIDTPTMEFIVRVAARIGFMFVLYGAYRLWHMPVLKRHANQFFWLAVIVCSLSLIYTVVEYFFLIPIGSPVLTIAFNTVGTWVLAIFMNYRAYKIGTTVGSDKVRQYQNEIDRQIEEIKRAARQG